MKSNINSQEEIEHLKGYFKGVVDKYTEQLQDARDNTTTDAMFGKESDMAGVLSFLDKVDGKLESLLAKYPETREGLIAWFLCLLWRSSSAVKPIKDIDTRQDLIFSLVASFAPSNQAMDNAVSLLQHHSKLLEKAQETREHANYQGLFHDCLCSYRELPQDEVADAILQIGAENLVQIQLDATKELMAYWQAPASKKSFWH